MQLPVSGMRVSFRPPTGREDLLLRESRLPALALGQRLVTRLARTDDGAPVDAAGLSVTDFEALLLAIRQSVLGDVIRAEAICQVPDCRARADVSFRISDYLASHAGRTPRGIESHGEGWFRLTGKDLRFRLPTGADLLAIEHEPAPYRTLVRRCIDPPDAPENLRRRAESAMGALAPALSRKLPAECPECHAPLNVYFEATSFVLREVCARAAGIYQDVHLLALHYGWPEEKILALPQSRRTEYVELLRNQGAAA
jgi:hypothetical protein